MNEPQKKEVPPVTMEEFIQAVDRGFDRLDLRIEKLQQSESTAEKLPAGCITMEELVQAVDRAHLRIDQLERKIEEMEK